VEVIRRGAEAEIRAGEWKGRRVLIKTRTVKGYRHPDLDADIRSQRTRNEARLIQEARRLGVPTPIIYDIDLERAELVLQDVGRSRVKDALSGADDDAISDICREIGRLAALLHAGGMVHGDLTTSNMILSDGRIWLIDFSLGNRNATIEEMGVDMHLLREAFLSAHSEIIDRFQEVLDSYAEHCPFHEEIFKKVRQIEARGRYT
jgi:Kae1-associated kinase Bud32